MGLGKWIMMYFTGHRFVRSEKKKKLNMRGIDKFYPKLWNFILHVEPKLLKLELSEIPQGD